VIVYKGDKMSEVYDKLMSCYRSVKSRVDFTPEVALVLGSGLGNYAEKIDIRETIDYKDIEGFPVSTAPGHKGRFVFGYVGKVPVVIMQGRFHYYEGYDMTDVVLPIRLMHLMGAGSLILTNASGGIRSDLEAGDIMLIRDQISAFVPSPLRGANIRELGNRFPDMSHIYDPGYIEIAEKCAETLGIQIKKGVYVQTKGPNYESPAEIQMYKILGADAVGMSTTVEAIAANHMDMKILGISCISNLAAGISPNPLTEEEVIEAGKMVEDKLTKLVTAVIEKIGD
jgi:purine-nucleoside phosphorylase